MGRSATGEFKIRRVRAPEAMLLGAVRGGLAERSCEPRRGPGLGSRRASGRRRTPEVCTALKRSAASEGVAF